MPDREKAIRILEGSYKNFVLRHNGELLTVNELIALLKAQEPADAIPVEWMRDKMRGYASALKSTETAALVMVMQMWQKEQEAR